MAVTLIGGVSFIDDVRSLPDSVRLVAQFIAMVMMFYQLDILRLNMWWVLLLALIVCVGASNIINFMDGIKWHYGWLFSISIASIDAGKREVWFC